jgi:tetratricopeptide (TPR) repeat protein
LHTINALLVLALFGSMTGRWGRSATIGALFAIHPLHVESVAWIVERKDVLSTLFGLLSLLAYVQYTRGIRKKYYLLALVAFICSLLSKQTLVTLPFLLLLIDLWPLNRWRHSTSLPSFSGSGWNSASSVEPSEEKIAHDFIPTPSTPRPAVKLILEKIPFLLATIAFSAVAFVAQSSHSNVKSLDTISLRARVLNALIVYCEYLRKAIIPTDLGVFYPHPEENVSVVAAAAALAFLLIVMALSISQLRRRPFLFVGWSWYLGTLVPMIGIVQIGAQKMADRYTYFPLLGAFAAVVWFIAELFASERWRKFGLPLASVTSVAALSAMAIVQVGYWKDSVTLFTHTVNVTVDNTFARGALFSALFDQGEIEQGLAHFRSAVDKSPDDGRTHFNFACCLEKAGRIEEAKAEYEAALAVNELEARAHNNLGAILCDEQQYEAAIVHLRRAAELDSRYPTASMNLGRAYAAIGKYVDAIEWYEAASRIDPACSECQYAIGMLLRRQGQFHAALEHFQSALQLAPQNDLARQQLARTQYELGLTTNTPAAN